jgi:Leucine-rich repeat (LRR) protein
MKTDKNILRKSATMLVLIVSGALMLEACAKEPSPLELTGIITMTTKAAKVQIGVVGDKDIVIDWGDGKKSNLNDALYDELYKQFMFTHDYSGANTRYIAITGDITRLSCGNNELTALDVSGSTGLTELSCYFNQLTGLDVSKNTALIRLDCSNNQLINLKVNDTALGNLDCSNNKLTVSALNGLFGALSDKTKTDGYYKNPELHEGFIRIGGNPGAGDCDSSIAQKKGWRFRNR